MRRQEPKWWMSASGKPEVRLVFIDPAMAADALTRNPNNRNQSPALIRKYDAKMRAMRWHITNQGIGFFDDGTLADGQHRLQAIVQSSIGQEIVVVVGISKDAAMAIDDLRPRSEADRLMISGFGDDQLKARIAVVRCISEMTRSSDSHNALLTEDIAEIIDAYSKELNFVIRLTPKVIKGLSHSCFRGAIFSAVVNGANRDSIERFLNIVQTGSDAMKHEAAAIRLRDYLLTANTGGARNDRKQIFLRSQRALKAFLDGHGITKLYAPEIPIWECKFLFSEGEKQETA